MLESDETKVQADAIEQVAYRMDFIAGDITNRFAVVRVSEEKHWIILFSSDTLSKGRGDAGGRLRELTSSHETGHVGRDLFGSIVYKLCTLRIARQDKLGVGTLRVCLDSKR